MAKSALRRCRRRGLTIVGELLDQRQCRGAAVAGGGRQGGGHLAFAAGARTKNLGFRRV